jgi:CubicO group peptidase (beta-lactamase class C family)
MANRVRRLVLPTIGIGLTCALAAAAWFGVPALSVGVGHKARVLCSGVFVSRRTPAAVLADLQADDLSVLRYVTSSIDTVAHTVTARALGVERRAVYREGLGCALALDNLTPPRLPRRDRDPDVGPGSSDTARLTPAEPSDAGRPRAELDAVVARAFDEPDPRYPRRTRAVLVMQGGRIIAERYSAGIGPDTALAGWSMSKSVMNALVGVLVRDGRVAVDAPVPIPEWHRPGDPRAAITLDQLLRMSSGLRFAESQHSPRSDVMRMLFAAGDIAAFVTSRESAVAPGIRWEYSNAGSNIIAAAIRNVLHDPAAYLTFPRRVLFDPMGMSSAVLETDAAGTFIGSSYMYATARDWGRFGMLYLRDGVWNGTRLLPPGWVDYTRTPAPADATKRYGAHFWLEIPPEYAGSDPRLPVPALHAAGHEGQLVTIVPSHDLVIVRLGRTRDPHAWDHAAFVRGVLASVDPRDQSLRSSHSPHAARADGQSRRAQRHEGTKKPR